MGWSALILAIFCMSGFGMNRLVSVMVSSRPVLPNHTVVIDAGHGGEDGGAISCTGIAESQINLEISIRLQDLMNLLGYRTVMIRTGDYSVYTQGQSLSQKKVSDLKTRVQMVKETQNPLLVSIHQNYFSESRYCGAQVFYGKSSGSRTLAAQMQEVFVTALNPGSNRAEKAAQNIYLLESVDCNAVLVECGFLSNPVEERNLQDGTYQKKISCIIATSVCNFLSTSPTLA